MFSSGQARNLKKKSTRKSISSFSSHVLQTSLKTSLVPSVSAVSAEEQWGSDVDPWFRPVGQHPWHLWCGCLISFVDPLFFGTAEKLGNPSSSLWLQASDTTKLPESSGPTSWWFPAQFWWSIPPKGPPRVVKLCVQHKSNGYCRFCKVKMVIKNSLPKILI